MRKRPKILSGEKIIHQKIVTLDHVVTYVNSYNNETQFYSIQNICACILKKKLI